MSGKEEEKAAASATSKRGVGKLRIAESTVKAGKVEKYFLKSLHSGIVPTVGDLRRYAKSINWLASRNQLSQYKNRWETLARFKASQLNTLSCMRENERTPSFHRRNLEFPGAINS